MSLVYAKHISEYAIYCIIYPVEFKYISRVVAHSPLEFLVKAVIVPVTLYDSIIHLCGIEL